MLTYKKKRIIQHEESETTDQPITVPENWGMFTNAGNKKLTTLAQKFLDKANKAHEAGSTLDFVKAALEYLRTYRGLEKYKTYSEAGDTDVRECVWDFFGKVCDAVGMDGDSLWEQKEAYPKEDRW